MSLIDKLFEYEDEKYGNFQVKLTPGLNRDRVIGVRVPIVRKIAKEVSNSIESREYIKVLPHFYYDENMLHGLIISEIKDYDECIKEVDRFLPYVDNWAVCDIMSPKVFKKNKDRLLIKINEWIRSDRVYTIRFAIEMLMSHYLDGDYKKEYMNIPLISNNQEYYVRMMIAWFYATALAKQYDDAIKIIEDRKLDKWTHNKIIQKAIESYRISEENKTYLRSLKY